MGKILIKLACPFTILLTSFWFLGISLAAGLYDESLKKYRAGEFTEAIDLLLKKSSKDSGDYNLLGWSFLKSGEKIEAIKQFEQSLSLNPNLYDSYCGLGYSYYQLGRFHKSLQNFNKGTPQGSKSIDCLLGKGLVLEKIKDTEGALDAFKKVLSVNKDNHVAAEKVFLMSPKRVDNSDKEDMKFFARGNYFWVKRGNKKVEPVFIKGVNMGFALPGRFPTEFPENVKTYLKWFKLIGEMNANLIRVYTILPPQFYKAFAEYNHDRKAENRLFLIQGIWAKLPEKHNFKARDYLKETRREIKNALDVIHGNADLPHRYGHAYGIYRHDVSDYVLGYIFGREWEPPDVVAYNKLSSASSFSGKYLSIANANPMEVWLTEILDYLINYETDRYKTQKPVAFMNWPPLDPLFHKSEATYREEVKFRRRMGEIVPPIDYSKTYDEDVVTLDETKIIVNREYKPGIFSSHHVYPYYPDFLRNEEKYRNISFPEGSSYYYNYLKDLKKYYKNMPLLISEFGMPTSRGVARFHPEGLNHGGHNESEQAEFLKKMTFSIEQAGCAGGIIFSWIDEWFKSNWMVKGMEKRGRFWYNAQDPEESYGLIAMRPAGIEKLKGKTSAWKTATKLYSKGSESPLKVLDDGFDGARNIKRIYADFDAGYLYLRIDIDGEVDWGKVAYLIALDTIGSSEGDHRLPFNLDLESPIGFEYVILLHGERSKILIDDRYNRTVFDNNLLRFPGQSGYKKNSNFKSVYNNNGLYTELITTHRRRFSRDGKIFPEGIYNASILKQGSLAYDSNSDFYFSKENKFIEVRIPWNLLNFSDPSKLKIIYSNKEQKITDGLRIMAASYKPRNINNSTSIELQDGANATDVIPRNLANIRYYRWQGWEFPKYITGLKKSYYAMKETYKKIKSPDFKINLPTGFNFISVIESHYKSLGKFTNYLYNIENSSTTNLYALALTNLIKGLVKNEPFYILEAKYLFSSFYNTSTDSKERHLSKLSMQYAESILTGEYKKAPDTKDILERVTIEKKNPPSGDFQRIIIGKSAIKLKKNAKIKTQVERVTRDWLSVYNPKKPPWAFVKENIVPWHEGARIKEIVAYTDAQVYPVWGTIAKRFGNNWYAQDNDGIFRFMFSEDKVFNYPTNIIIDDKTVIVNDTHGISAIAWDSLGADLAVGCGDNIGKAEAAYYLARKGVNVYMPADRFLHVLIGTETKGKIIGSAPVKKIAGQAVIGDQPISIDVNEPVVVSNAKGGYPLQYYDAPYLYFKELERYIGKTMNIIPVDITVYGKASKVVDKARKIGGKLIGIRVWGKEEHDSVASWLEEDKSHRAILFHTALYPEGYRLFFEYPQQTSFGDINIEIER